MAINFFNSEKILRLTPLAKDTKAVADNMVAGDVRVFPKLPNVQVNALEDLWEMKFESAPSTYALYVYALYPVSYLLNAYEATRGSDYLEKAVALVNSFIDWELKSEKGIDNKRKQVLFGDHAVSNRTQVLCYLACCLKEAGREIPNSVKAALLRNGSWLADIENYSHYNHGLMMDLALLGLVNTYQGLMSDFPNSLSEWAILKISLVRRLRQSVARDLTEDGVHIENSPGYHFWMLGFLERITPALENFDRELYLQVQKLQKKANDYAAYITRPDGTVPALGDTHAGVRYRSRKGLGSKFFKHANQVVFRSPQDDVWAHLMSGYRTHVHKHSDNGSFTMQYKGEDLLVDPGFLNYENTEESRLMKSASFHNTAGPEGQDQIIKRIKISGARKRYKRNASSSRIVSFTQTPNFESAFAVVSDYGDSLVERLVVWLKPSAFIIFDSIKGHTGAMEQFHHIAPGMTIEEANGRLVRVFSKGTLICTIAPLSVWGLQLNSYQLEALPGYVASSFNEKRPSTRIRVSSNRGYICSLIILGGEFVDSDALDFLRKEHLEKLKLRHAR
jgi:hypothetical protein